MKRLRKSTKLIAQVCITLIIIGCSKPRENIDWDYLEGKFSVEEKDSLRLQAVSFLRSNMEGLKSELVLLVNENTRDTIKLHEVDFLNFDEDSLKRIISEGYKVSRTELLDTKILTTADIQSTINAAFKSWEDKAWHDDIPKEIFFEYLLPYKIFNEYPGNWREVLRKDIKKDYMSWTDTVSLEYQGLEKVNYVDSLVNKIVVPSHMRWYEYSVETIKLGTVPSFNELAILKGGDCFNEAAIDAYLFKAVGIPAGFDVIPYWGSVNGTHATAVYYNPGQNKMRLIIGFPYSPAKVFRRMFSVQNTWEKEIKPVVGDSRFDIEYLKSNRLMDVTHEHVKTADIAIQAPETANAAFAYLTVLNYEQWRPVFWGKADNGKFVFRNMGKNILYRLAVPKDGDVIYGVPFLFTDDEQMIYPEVYSEFFETFPLNAINHGEESYVKKGRSYLLFYMNEYGEWVPQAKQTCTTDNNLNFKNIPRATFYKLVEVKSSKKLSRIFAFVNGRQQWH